MAIASNISSDRIPSTKQLDSKQEVPRASTVSIASLSDLWEVIKEDWIAHGRDWTRPGFRAVAVCRFGVWRMTVRFKLFRAPLTILYRMLYAKVRNTYGIELPYTTNLGRRVVFEHQGNIVIHGYCTIGDDCIIRQGVTLGLRYVEHPFDVPVLGDRVNIGAGAKLFGKIQIGDDVNIGANAVVLIDVPSGTTAVGVPAKVVKAKARSAKAPDRVLSPS